LITARIVVDNHGEQPQVAVAVMVLEAPKSVTERLDATKYAERQGREVQVMGVGPHDRVKEEHADHQPTSAAGAREDFQQDEESGAAGLSTKTGRLRASFHANSQKTKLGASESCARAVDQRD
jgi:hypothetical protein